MLCGMQYPQSEAPRPWAIAHRGLHGEELYELAHLQAVKAAGATAIECDIRTRGNGELVLRHSPLSRGVRTPPLADVLTHAGELALDVYLDVKDLDRSGAARLTTHIKDHAAPHTEFVFASADPAVLMLGAEYLPDTRRALLVRTPMSAERAVHAARKVGAQLIHPCLEWLPWRTRALNETWAATVHDSGLGIVSWHEEKPAVLRHLAGLGLFGICTDDMPRLAAALQA